MVHALVSIESMVFGSRLSGLGRDSRTDQIAWFLAVVRTAIQLGDALSSFMSSTFHPFS